MVKKLFIEFEYILCVIIFGSSFFAFAFIATVVLCECGAEFVLVEF